MNERGSAVDAARHATAAAALFVFTPLSEFLKSVLAFGQHNQIGNGVLCTLMTYTH